MTPRRTVAAVIGASALVGGVPAPAQAAKPSPRLKTAYEHTYARAEKAGHEPGRQIVEDGVRAQQRTRPATTQELRRSLVVLRRMVAAPVTAGGSTASAGLQAIAACESGGNPAAVDASGIYRGKYQFDLQTWQSVGGAGDPAAAPEAEQDRRAQLLLSQRGTAPWPVCGG